MFIIWWHYRSFQRRGLCLILQAVVIHRKNMGNCINFASPSTNLASYLWLLFMTTRQEDAQV